MSRFGEAGKIKPLPGMGQGAHAGGSALTATVDVREHHASDRRLGEDQIAQEMPVALVYNGVSHAVMMATPSELEAFALGFSLTEGIISKPEELYSCDVQARDRGISLELEIAAERMAGLRERRRNLAGRTGCGLCGAESLAQAMGPVAQVTAPVLTDAAVQKALGQLQSFQPLQAETGATHAAAWCRLDGTIEKVSEDVGRHNALDKLVGFLARHGRLGSDGFALISSRASYEMVHKSCAVGIGALVAVSAPTSLAIEEARQSGQLLIGFARQGRHVIYNGFRTAEGRQRREDEE
ncbi:formate dehydrogenase accessory sulfurtransferase FdhD [Parahaliea maris]|nr:formate dehydrogenase accessory sulfurtransferase FdhD [Parahaliea maris]